MVRDIVIGILVVAVGVLGWGLWRLSCENRERQTQVVELREEIAQLRAADEKTEAALKGVQDWVANSSVEGQLKNYRKSLSEKVDSWKQAAEKKIDEALKMKPSKADAGL